MPVHPVAIVARREIRDTFSDWRIAVPLLAFSLHPFRWSSRWRVSRGSGKGGPWKPSSLFMVLLPSGLVGLLAGLLSQAGLDPWVFLAAFVLPHGVVEFAAAIIATALILRIGASIISPRQGNSIGDSILVAFADFMKMLAVIAPMFVIAALIEAETTPRVARYFLGG